MRKITRPPIEDRIAFIDSIAFWLRKKPSNEILVQLKKLCGHMHMEQKMAWFNPEYRCRIQLHQPTQEALELLKKIYGTDIFINLVHVALDLTVADDRKADRLHEYINSRLVKLWRGNQKLGKCETTYYICEDKWRNHNIVTYSDKDCKINGKPCLHIEWRANGRPQVKGLGLETPEKLLGLDMREFWEKRLILEDINLIMLGKQFKEEPHAKKPMLKEYWKGHYVNIYERIGALLVRKYAQLEWGLVSAQKLRDWGSKHPWFRSQTVMIRLDNKEFLPVGPYDIYTTKPLSFNR